MSVFDEMSHLKADGLTQAAAAYETLSGNPDLTAMSIFKAAVSTKCGELIARLSATESNPESLHDMLDIIEEFFEDAVMAGGEAGVEDRLSHTAALELDKVLTVTEEILNDPAMFAQRMHALDGVILLSAHSFGKEQDMKDNIAKMQRSFMGLLLSHFIMRAKDELDAN